MAPKWATAPPMVGEALAMEGLDFHAAMDDAWYTVWICLEGEGTLHVIYYNFSDVYNKLYWMDGFQTVEELEEFRDSFGQ